MNKITETEPQEPKILRKRIGRKPKKAASFERRSFEPIHGNQQKPDLFKFTLGLLYKVLYLYGITLLRYWLRVKRSLKKAAARFAAAIVLWIGQAGRYLRRWAEGFRARFKAPFLRIRRTYLEVRPQIISKREKGKFPLVEYLAVLETIGVLILKILATLFNYLAPVVAAVAFFTITGQRLAEPMLYVLTYNDEVLGYVESSAVFNAAAQDVRSRVTINGESAFEVMNPHYEFMRKSEFEDLRAKGEIPATADKIDQAELADKLILASSADVEEAYGLYINNRFLGAVTDKDPILNKFEEIKRAALTGKPDEEVAFTKTVRLTSPALYPKSSVTTSESLVEAISRNETQRETYIVKAGDSPSLISDKTGVPYDVLLSLNSDIETNLTVGKEIITQVARPYMSVESTYTDIVEEEVPFETIKVENATYAKGYTDVFQEGVNGLREVTYRVSAMDGLERRRVEVSERILTEPIPERVTVGINNPVYVAPYQPSQQTSPGSQQTSPGSQQTVPATPPPSQPVQNPTGARFIRPVPAGSGCYISCYLGGYPGHTGIDIAGGSGMGTPILASASGVVSKAVNSNVGYGRHIVIDHGNGYSTLYAHNSALYVKVGDRVSQGQVIAAMGRTGNATGVHVHFEVRLNGQIRNPVDYIGRF